LWAACTDVDADSIWTAGVRLDGTGKSSPSALEAALGCFQRLVLFLC